MVRAEVIVFLQGPPLPGVLHLDEDASLLPLHVDESVEIGGRPVLLFVLVVEGAGDGIESRGIPFRVVAGVHAHLHLQHVLPYDRELQVPPQVQDQFRKRNHVRLGGNLEKGSVVQAQDTQFEVLPEGGGEDAHRFRILPDDAQGVIIDVVREQGISCRCMQPPVRDVQGGLNPGRGRLGEIVVPHEVVRVQMLLIEVRLLQGGGEAPRERDGTLGMAAEREDAESGVGRKEEITRFRSGEVDFPEGIPCQVTVQPAFGPGVGIDRIPLHGLGLPEVTAAAEVVETLVAVPDAAFHLGYHGILVPGLEAKEHPVVQPDGMEGVRALGGVDVELVVVEGLAGQVGRIYGVRVHLVIDGPFASGADKDRSQVLVQGVLPDPGRVAAVFPVLDKGERDAVGLVQEDRPLGVLVVGGGQGDVDFPHVHGRIPDHRVVQDAAVLRPVHGIPDQAGVQEVFPADVVAAHVSRLVAPLLVLDDTGTAIGLVFQGKVQGREDVLCREKPDVVVGLRLGIQQIARVGKLRVRGLRVEHRDGGGRVGPALVRGIVTDGGGRVRPSEKVVGLNGRAGYPQRSPAEILFHVGIVIEMVVERGVPVHDFHPVEIRVMLPGDKALVVEAVRQESGLEDARGVLPDAVSDMLEAVLDMLYGVLFAEDDLEFLLIVVFLALRLGKARVPAAELLLRDGRGVGEIQGVDDRPVQAVARRLQGVDDEPVREGVPRGHIPFIEERVRGAETVRHLHRIAREDLRRRVFLHGSLSEEIELIFSGVFPHGVEPRRDRHLHRVPVQRIRLEGVPPQRVQPQAVQQGEPAFRPEGPGCLHPDRPRHRQPGDHHRHEYFGPQVFHVTCKYTNYFLFHPGRITGKSMCFKRGTPGT